MKQSILILRLSGAHEDTCGFLGVFDNISELKRLLRHRHSVFVTLCHGLADTHLEVIGDIHQGIPAADTVPCVALRQCNSVVIFSYRFLQRKNNISLSMTSTQHNITVYSLEQSYAWERLIGLIQALVCVHLIRGSFAFFYFAHTGLLTGNHWVVLR